MIMAVQDPICFNPTLAKVKVYFHTAKMDGEVGGGLNRISKNGNIIFH